MIGESGKGEILLVNEGPAQGKTVFKKYLTYETDSRVGSVNVFNTRLYLFTKLVDDTYKLNINVKRTHNNEEKCVSTGYSNKGIPVDVMKKIGMNGYESLTGQTAIVIPDLRVKIMTQSRDLVVELYFNDYHRYLIEIPNC